MTLDHRSHLIQNLNGALGEETHSLYRYTHTHTHLSTDLHTHTHRHLSTDTQTHTHLSTDTHTHTHSHSHRESHSLKSSPWFLNYLINTNTSPWHLLAITAEPWNTWPQRA